MEKNNKKSLQASTTSIPPIDQELFDKMNRKELYKYIFMQIKNIWRVDGLYFLGIEKHYDTNKATEIDAHCWRYMGKIEARELKKLLNISRPSPSQMLLILRHTSWAVSHEIKNFGIEKDGSSFFSIIQCRTQLIRLEKGLKPHPCSLVREGYLEAFTKECNPDIKLKMVSCPPNRKRKDLWCLWRFFKK